MSIALRTLLMWLMAAAIPLQGFAATAMPVCAPDVQAAASNVVHAPDRHAGHAHAHAVSVSGAQHHHGSAAPLLSDMQPSDHAAGDALGHDMLKCCSATCAMAAVFTPVNTASGPVRAPAPAHRVARLHPGIVLDGLDRPPRPLLA